MRSLEDSVKLYGLFGPFSKQVWQVVTVCWAQALSAHSAGSFKFSICTLRALATASSLLRLFWLLYLNMILCVFQNARLPYGPFHSRHTSFKPMSDIALHKSFFYRDQEFLSFSLFVGSVFLGFFIRNNI